MDKMIHCAQGERETIFLEVSRRKGFSPSFVEKDFWVVWVLGRLFSSRALSSKILFKGGTSLSKVFGLIDRFSEDIDLILDWNEVVLENPMAARSKSKQDAFNKIVSTLSQQYIKGKFLPEMKRLLGDVCSAEVEDGAPDMINIQYPSSFGNAYLRPEIRLEIGPLAQWVPNAEYSVSSYVAETFPELFDSPLYTVRAIKAERTFWEKATILHHEAHRPETSPVPARYSRHYYDLYLMAADELLKASAFGELAMLASVVEFKEKFYPRGWARYDLAKPGSFKLVPPQRIRNVMRKDYAAMREMIFGRCPGFDEIVAGLKILEEEINALETAS